MSRSNPENRHCYIELLAYWEGRINTSNLVRQFSISRQQASKDISSYVELAPHNLVYDSSLKAYCATENFRVGLISGNVADYLAWAQNPQNELVPFSVQPLLSPGISHHTLNLPERKVTPAIIRGLVSAIRQKKRIEVDYVSLNNPNREGRVIAPHSFVNTGLRWHLRAWCEKSQEYRDFVLSRFRGEPELLDKTQHTAAHDIHWNTQVSIILQPDPRLTPEKREVLENDYQMQNGQLHISTKGCLVQYLLREMQVNTKMLDGTPEAQQLVLVNSRDIKPWLFE